MERVAEESKMMNEKCGWCKSWCCMIDYYDDPEEDIEHGVCDIYDEVTNYFDEACEDFEEN